MREKTYSMILTEENKSKVEQFLKLLNIDTDITECENVLEDESKEKEWPQDGDGYYFINSVGVIADGFFYTTFNPYGKNRLDIGNCFKTKEEAEFELERLKVLAEMKKFAEPENRDWDGNIEHWCIYYECVIDSIKFLCKMECKYDGIYFESAEKAQECVKAVGKDRIKKYYLRIKE